MISNSKSEQLLALFNEMENAVDQLPLAQKPEDIVPGEGDPDADVIFIGEAPGKNEAEQRRPFVGRSGQLLRETLEEIGLSPEEKWISNIVKVRPPDNRDPKADEISAYREYLNREIEIIQPAVIVTLGRFAMEKFISDVKISQVHGRLHKVSWNDKTHFVLPVYHPAAALRNGNFKETFIEDLTKLKKIIPWVLENNEQYQEDDLTSVIEETLL